MGHPQINHLIFRYCDKCKNSSPTLCDICSICGAKLNGTVSAVNDKDVVIKKSDDGGWTL